MKEIVQYIKETQTWLSDFVIQLNLCPFAGKPFKEDKIRYEVCMGLEYETLVYDLIQEMQLLQSKPTSEIETTLLIYPRFLDDFEDYLDFADIANTLLDELGLRGVLQIATFHPDYQFAETDPHDVSNKTNRSPYPMLHLLREDSVEKAVASYPDVDKIPEQNILKLRELFG